MSEISGFEISGFKSFYSHPQQIFPLGKMTILAGPNNSGKSNIFRFAEKFLSPLANGRTALPELAPLDIPILPEGVAAPDFSFGASLTVSNPTDLLGDVFGDYRSRLGNTTRETLEALLRHPSIYDEERGAIWFRYQCSRDRAPQLAGEFIPAAFGDLHATKHLFSDAASKLLNRASSPESDALALMEQIAAKLKFPRVVTIPAFREIIPDGSPMPDLTRLDGRGLPGFLHALHSPSAERYREDSKKFQRINRFLQSVLEEEDAKIAIPYNSTTVHISVGERVLPIESLGAGISQVVMLAAASTWHSGALVCIEEPEVHLHPILLRKLAHYLMEETDNRYLLSTHSTSLMDNPNVTVMDISHTYAHGTEVRTAVTESCRARISRSLGYRASDILQCNFIVWVEGPSDRIYINHWINQTDSGLIEGIHYTVMFYGGKLLSHLSGAEYTAPEGTVGDFISLLKINRNMAIVIDSDLKSASEGLRETKARIIREFSSCGGYAWVTEGREIENYVPSADFRTAALEVHDSSDPQPPTEKYGDMFTGVKRTRANESGVATPDKVKIALAATRNSDGVWDVLDLKERVAKTVDLIRKANHL